MHSLAFPFIQFPPFAYYHDSSAPTHPIIPPCIYVIPLPDHCCCRLCGFSVGRWVSQFVLPLFSLSFVCRLLFLPWQCLWFLFNTANIYHLCFPLVVLSPTLASPWIQETHQVSNSPLGHFIRIKQKTVITLVSSTIQLMWKMKYAASSSAEPSCSKTSPANYTEP